MTTIFIPPDAGPLLEASILLGERLLAHPAIRPCQRGKLEYALAALRGLPAPWEGPDWSFGFEVHVPDLSRKLYIWRSWDIYGYKSESSPDGYCLDWSSIYTDPEANDIANMGKECDVHLPLSPGSAWHYDRDASLWIKESSQVNDHPGIIVEIH